MESSFSVFFESILSRFSGNYLAVLEDYLYVLEIHLYLLVENQVLDHLFPLQNIYLVTPSIFPYL